jgi:transposase-like protein
MSPKPGTNADRQIVEMYGVGMGVRMIAKRLTLTPGIVRAALHRNRVQMRTRAEADVARRKLLKPSDGKIARVFEETYSTKETTKRLHISRGYMLASLRRRGVEVRPPGISWRVPPVKQREIATFATKRGSHVAASHFGLSRSTVMAYGKRHAAQPTRRRRVSCAGCGFPTTEGPLCGACQLVS